MDQMINKLKLAPLHLQNSKVILMEIIDLRPTSNGVLASESSSFPRTDIAIKDISVILEKKADVTLHLESKTSAKVFETEPKDRKPNPSFNLTC